MTDDESRELGRLAGGLETLVEATRGLEEDVKQTRTICDNNGQRIARLEVRLRAIITELARLHETVVSGNGKTPLVQRHAVLHSHVDQLEKDFHECRQESKRREQGRQLSRTQIVVAVIALCGTAVTAVAALITALLQKS